MLKQLVDLEKTGNSFYDRLTVQVIYQVKMPNICWNFSSARIFCFTLFLYHCELIIFGFYWLGENYQSISFGFWERFID